MNEVEMKDAHEWENYNANVVNIVHLKIFYSNEKKYDDEVKDGTNTKKILKAARATLEAADNNVTIKGHT